MTPMRPGWYRVRIEGCASWQCAEVVDSSSDPSADPRFVEWAGRDWPITDIAEWGERITMPDEQPRMCDGTVRMVRGRGQSDVLLPCTKPIDHDGPCEMTELLFGKAGA